MSTLSVTAQTKQRVESIDLLRGLIMIIMALDHIRDYFHADAALYDPLDLEKTTAALFFTRWITHFCAPVFMLLSGVSAYMVGERKGKKYLSRFLFTRGLWLIFLEFTIVNFGWYFNPHFPVVNFLVIWALGLCMVLLAVIIYLPLRVIMLLSIIAIFGHNMLDNVHVPGDGAGSFVWALLHELKILNYGGYTFFIAYPLVPWIAVMAVGYCTGKLYGKDFDAAKRKKILLRSGAASLLLFIAIRFTNMYGDTSLWSTQSSALLTFFSFIKVSKYPPSLLYVLVTLGPAFLFLAFNEQAKGWLSAQLKMIGRVAMFYYLLHLYIIHLLAMAATYLCGFTWRNMILDTWINFEPKLQGYGFNLGVVYLVWMLVIIILYFLCRRYDKYKRNHPQYWWLSYL